LNAQNEVSGGYTVLKIPYGIDEVFTNTTFYNWLIRHDVKCLVVKDFTSAGWYLQSENLISEKEHRLYMMHYHTNDVRIANILKKIFMKKLPLIVDKHPCLQEIIDLMPRLKGLFLYYVVKGSQLE
jgi:hypothetical protein